MKVAVVIDSVPGPRGVAVSPDGTTLYVTNVKENTVTVVDVQRRRVTDVIRVGQMPTCVGFVNNGREAYVTCQAQAQVCVINVALAEVTTRIAVAGNPISVTID